MCEANEAGGLDRGGEPIGLARIHRSMDRDHDAIVAHGRFGALVAAWRDHAALWEERDPDPLSVTMMGQALAATALHLACRPRDEICAFTINVPQPPINLFIAGESEPPRVTGRVFTENVDVESGARFFVQTRRSGGRRYDSVIDVEGLDVLLMFEDYYARSMQHPARFIELSEEPEVVAVVALPGVDRVWLDALDPASARRLVDSERLQPLDVRDVWFECGCTPKRLIPLLRAAYPDADTLFDDQESVRCACPRCGRTWTVTREQFEAEDSGDEPSPE